ncbi:hypothetical protein O181_000475 [Austropuccinia psidii MF-1]|uniref:DUF1746 domain-containing protein n=1 Tax=Austropuccinia psidii MF-1 TaxID=1389203 RepID=A0A9Q3B8Z1_9BASI|nr:hypothetical protein [Austropuccinia psidii MF-1]
MDPQSTSSQFVYHNTDNETKTDSGINKTERERKIKLTMFMHQLDFFFYLLTVLAYILDGRTLIFILRTMSQIQFSHPKHIHPDRPLRFFTLASFAISFCAALSHLSIFYSNHSFINPHGILVDFIGQSTWNHKLTTIGFLIGLDTLSCSIQLLLVLLSFTCAHSIPISSSDSTSPLSQDLSSIDGNDNNNKDGSYATDPLLPISTSESILNEACRTITANGLRLPIDRKPQTLLFDLSISRAIALLLSPDPPNSSSPLSTPAQAATSHPSNHPETDISSDGPISRNNNSDDSTSIIPESIITNPDASRTVAIPIS